MKGERLPLLDMPKTLAQHAAYQCRAGAQLRNYWVYMS